MKYILYLDDYINLYDPKTNEIICYKPYKKTLRNGYIIDKNKFIKIYNKMLKEYNLNNSLFGVNILVIIGKNYSIENKNLLIKCLEELNYHKIDFIQELNYLKIKKNDLYVNANETYMILYYLNTLGKIESLILPNVGVIRKVITIVTKEINKKNIYVYGKNYQEFIKLIDDKHNYYYFYDSDNLIIKKMLNEKSVR